MVFEPLQQSAFTSFRPQHSLHRHKFYSISFDLVSPSLGETCLSKPHGLSHDPLPSRLYFLYAPVDIYTSLYVFLCSDGMICRSQQLVLISLIFHIGPNIFLRTLFPKIIGLFLDVFVRVHASAP